MGGLALLQYRTAPDKLYVDGVAVLDEMRGKDIGSRLFGLLERIALERGIRTICLEVIDTNPRGKALYERVSFVVTNKRRVWPFNLVYSFPFQSANEMGRIIGQQDAALDYHFAAHYSGK